MRPPPQLNAVNLHPHVGTFLISLVPVDFHHKIYYMIYLFCSLSDCNKNESRYLSLCCAMTKTKSPEQSKYLTTLCLDSLSCKMGSKIVSILRELEYVS
jgi:hypothetical protein